jgi:hypothetical protein
MQPLAANHIAKLVLDCPPGAGTPPKHDWDAFVGAISRCVHDHGMPVSQGELMRDMMEWFAGREDLPPPDERTVRRKVSAIWKELRPE